MNVRIVIDSTSDVTPEVRAQCTVVPLTVHFGEEEYIDGVTMNHRQFYEKLIESDVLPTTSQPTPEAFAQVYREAKEAGEEVVVLTIAAKLSGTYQSACIAAMDFPGMVHVVDSQTAAIGGGILAELAVELARQGLTAAQIAEELTRRREDVCLVAMLDTLEFLKRGGRLSKTAAFAGALLSIKPVITLQKGEIVVLGKARGSKQANNLLATEIQKAGGANFSAPILLGYSGLSDELLRKYIADSAPLWEGQAQQLNITPICGVIGTHAGPGAIAVAFFKK